MFSSKSVDSKLTSALQQSGSRVERVGEASGLLDLRQVLSLLHALGIKSVMVEGGGQVIDSFLREGLADRAMIAIATGQPDGYKIGDGRLPDMVDAKTEKVGKDEIIFGRLKT